MIVKNVRKHKNNQWYVITTTCGHIINVSLLNPPRFINGGTEIEVLSRGRKTIVVGIDNIFYPNF